MRKLTGKKLLILGAYLTEIEIIEAAKKEGVYTIVTDNHTDWSLAPAKNVADEAWDISWSDIEKLKAKCIESGVDGCFAGFSENRISCAQALCQALGRPFYSDNSKLNTIVDKLKFKQACIESGVTVPKSYKYGDEIEFPVIVKPADNGGSKGITVCHKKEEFESAYQKALDASINKTVVIEQYIVADETMVYFTVHNGKVDVSAMCDRYMHHFGNDITQLPVGYYYPSKHLDSFLQHNFESYKRLIHNLGIQNGLIAFQAFAVNNDLIPFDPTYRLDGTMTYHICENVTGSNVLNMLIHHSLCGTMGEDEQISSIENPHFDKVCFQLPILLKNGTITKVIGLDSVHSLKQVVHIFQKHHEGETMEKIADFSQIFCRIHMVGNSVEEIKDATKFIYDNLSILDADGNEMIICKMNINKIGL